MANVKVGDTVRFLNDVGGGRVVRINDKIAYVEDEDGFEMPVQVHECVVITPAPQPATKAPKTVVTMGKAPESARPEPVSKDLNARYEKPLPKVAPVAEAPVELPGGDTVNVMLGFEPQDIKSLSSTGFDAYIVNDSNYWLYASVATRDRGDREWTPRYDGLVEPNMQEFAWELTQEDLPHIDRLFIQLIAFKRGRGFEAKAPVSSDLKFDATKFVRLHCFRPNRYFETPVIAYDVVVSDAPAISFEPDAESIRKGMAAKANALAVQERRHESRSSKPGEPIVVDLHASELIDSTAGLSPAEILNLQIDRFTQVMDANLRLPGTKIVFIHGKGEGVLRQALMKELTHRYKGHDVQDASFQQYGFGATQVTIRNTPQPAAKAPKGGKRR